MLPTWKLAAEVLAGCAAVGISAATIFGADAAPKPRAVTVHHAPARHHATPPSTSTTTTVADVVPTGGDGSFTGGSDRTGGQAGNGALVGDAPTTTAGTGATDPGPPPTVPESEFPVALPISAVVVIGGGVGVVTWSRRRRAREANRR